MSALDDLLDVLQLMHDKSTLRWSGTQNVIKEAEAELATLRAKRLKIPNCSECRGTGKHECDCGHVHKCGYCEGTGMVIWRPKAGEG